MTNASNAYTPDTINRDTRKHAPWRATMICVAALGLAFVSTGASAQDRGYDNGYDSGYGSGYDNGYDSGYDTGYNNAPDTYYGNDYGYNDRRQTVTYSADGTERVEVTAPPYHHATRSTIGAPIRDVSLSQPVRFNDLNLRSAWGARELRHRVRYTARKLCNQLDRRYPISTSDSPPCYRTALRNAMYQANMAIRDARYGSAY